MKLCFAIILLLAVVYAETSGWGPEKVQQYTGYLTIRGSPGNGSHLFYWFFESRNQPSTDPTILWLTGGPGCSSMLALFYENGPYRFANGSTNVNLNPYSWNSFANLLYVDQPVGTGWSYADESADYVKNETEVAEDMYNFLLEFFALHPKYAPQDFYIIGESYAGHYVPAISARVVKGNAAGGAQINLKGSGIGNGLVDPVIQYSQYGPYMYANQKIGKATLDTTNVIYAACKALIDGGRTDAAFVECNLIVDAIRVTAGDFNVYDIRKPCIGSMCYDFSALTTQMTDRTFQQAIGVAGHSWTSCDKTVYFDLMGDWVANLEVDVPLLLAAGVRVLVYSGVEDFICNYFGGRAWTTAMQWPGQAAYNKVTPVNWNVNGTVAGLAQSYQNFTWLEVAAAGHMVPMDQPAAALDMVRRLLNGSPFN